MNKITGILPGRVFINDLTQSSRPGLILGIVIMKNEPKAIVSSRGNQSYLLTFMIRDSPTSSIICNCWGNKEYSTSTSSTFRIGDIVEIRNCQVRQQSESESQMKFQPFTSSPFQLIVSDKCGTIANYQGDPLPFDPLMNIPVKVDCKLVKIEEIYQNADKFEGQNSDLLVLFKKCQTPREIKTKTGKVLTKADIIVCDQTANSFAIQIWDAEWISFAQNWTRGQCVILAQDVKLSLNRFLNKMVGTVTSKTILTVNPDTREAHILYLFAQSMAAEEVDSEELNLDDIRDVYTIQGIKDKVNKLSDPREEKFRGIVYGCLTSMDLDGSISLVSTVCKSCGRKLDKDQPQCNNSNCPAGSGTEMTTAIQQIDLSIAITDHTGTVKQCQLMGSAAEAFLGCKANELILMRQSQLTMLKWKFVLERFKWHFQTSYRFSSRSTGIRVLSGTKVELAEWCSKVCN